MAQGLVDSSFKYHLISAKNNGVTRTEIAEILTHTAFLRGLAKSLGGILYGEGGVGGGD